MIFLKAPRFRYGPWFRVTKSLGLTPQISDTSTKRRQLEIKGNQKPGARIQKQRSEHKATIGKGRLSSSPIVTIDNQKSGARASQILLKLEMVDRLGIEPRTIGLKSRCSTSELPVQGPLAFEGVG